MQKHKPASLLRRAFFLENDGYGRLCRTSHRCHRSHLRVVSARTSGAVKLVEMCSLINGYYQIHITSSYSHCSFWSILFSSSAFICPNQRLIANFLFEARIQKVEENGMGEGYSTKLTVYTSLFFSLYQRLSASISG